MKSYLDLYVTDAPSGRGHKVYFVGMDNGIVGVEHHYPWFTAYDSSYVNVKKAVRVTRLSGIPLVYRRHSFIYVPDPELKVFKIEVGNRKEVPEKASSLARAGLYNIRYECRVAYDFSDRYKLLGFNTPLVFQRNNDMVNDLRKVIDVVSDFRVMAVDIEVASREGGFPRKGDPLVSVAYCVFRLGDIGVFTEDFVDKVEIIEPGKLSEDESRRVVEEFFNTILREKPNIIVTYNGSGFDIPYMAPFTGRNRVLTQTVIGVFEHSRKHLCPHIDLLNVREYLGSAMGIRSHVAYALDDVALEVAKQVEKYFNISWLWRSRYIEAERVMNHSKIREYFEKKSELLYTYIVADVYLTALISRIWLFPLYVLSVLTGIPSSVLQSMNTGQIAEYVLTEYLRKLGFYPELRRREYLYAKVSENYSLGDKVFHRGKTYTWDYGVFGGGDYKIVELDFNQMYPTDIVANSVDPTATFIASGVSQDKPADTTMSNVKTPLETHRVVLGLRSKKSDTAIKPVHVLDVVHGYGPISFLMYKLYVSRVETKKLKKKAGEEKKPELEAPDQAVKILNNSFYGCFSKERGNLVTELASASVFWRTQRILYDVIDYIDKEISRKYGFAKVVYGDTDSTYIILPRGVNEEQVVSDINKYIKEKHGELFGMSHEDTYDYIIIPKQKEEEEASAKSYICVKNNKIVKIRGEFFKLNAPLCVKERIEEIYMEIIKRKPSTVKELEEIIKNVIEKEDIHKMFIKKTITTFVNEENPLKLKKLNKTHHYAGLYTGFLYRARGVYVTENQRTLMDYSGDSWRTVEVRVNPRELEESQRAVIVLYLPHTSRDPKKFLVYVSDDGENAVVDHVQLHKLNIVSVNNVDESYVASFSYKRMKIPRETLVNIVLASIKEDVVETLYEKLVKAINKR